MADRLTATCPRSGYAINCTEARWNTHIVARHPEMDGHEDIVAEVLNDPMGIYQSDIHLQRLVYYRPSKLPTPHDRGLIRVIVQFNTDSRGRTTGSVVTAFPVYMPRKGEILIWPES